MSDPRFEYQNLRRPGLTVAQLDQMFSFVTSDVKFGLVGSIIAGVKLLVVVAYVFARERLISQEIAFKKQEYERNQAGENQGELDQDDLSGERT